MKRKIFNVVFVLMLVLGINLATSGMPTAAATLNVGPGETYTTIQAAISAASPGDTINVAAGMYDASSTIFITQGVTLLGPNAGINANTGSRVAEAIITSSAPTNTAIRISTTDPVTIDGFTFNGCLNPLDSYTFGSNPIFQNNIVENIVPNGEFYFNAPATLVFKDNDLTGFASSPNNSDALLVSGNSDGTTGTLVTIQGNVFDFGSASQGKDGMNLSNCRGEISDNTFANLAYYGILLANNSSNTIVTNNVFNDITNPAPATSATWGAGVRFYTPTGSGPVTITDNTFSNSYVGIGVRPGNSIAGMDANISHNTFINNNSNIRNDGNGAMNVTYNYWGTAVAATIAAKITGAGASLVNYIPYYVDSALTILYPSTDATLSDLIISSGTLNPAFASGTTNYTDNVANSVTSVTVMPTVNESHAAVTVNGVVVASGIASGAISLSVGTNPINIVVTAQDMMTTDTYIVTVTRYALAPTVASILPFSGPAAGGTPVTITGTGFVNGATVTIGGTPATGVTVTNDTTIMATAPAGTAGAQDVIVTNPDSQIATITNGFTYVTAPTATTNAASGITIAGATMNGTVNPENGDTIVTFQYGTDTNYGTTVNAVQSPVSAGVGTTPVSTVVTGLMPGTLYHFRVVATNSAGTTYGGDQTFTVKVTLTITANNSSKTEGSIVTFSGSEFTASGLINSDTVTSVTLTSAGAASTATPGIYDIVPSAAVGSGLGNYSITYDTGSLTVNPVITATSTGAGGAISPSGNIAVPYSTNQTFTITPYTDYRVENVVVDGNLQGAVAIYTFTNVTVDHTIAAYFEMIPAYRPPEITTTTTTTTTPTPTSPTTLTSTTTPTTIPTSTPTPTPIILSQQVTAGYNLSIQSDVTLDSQGVSETAGQIATADGNVSFNVAAGTQMLNAQGQPISEISASIPASIPPPPPQGAVVSHYDFGPAGATFVPPLTLTLNYDPSNFPVGSDQSALYIAWWNTATEQWVNLPSIVDQVHHTVMAQVPHFTLFSVVVPFQPAAFSLSNLSVTPVEVETGKNVTISTMVANTADLSGSYNVTLVINDKVVATKTITLAGNGSQEVDFTVTESTAGSYSVVIGNQTGSFVVNAAPTSTSSISTTSTTTTPTKTWFSSGWIIAIAVIAAVVIVIGVILLLLGRRREHK